ncbi:hypothetical protein IW152_003894 [Coemansia sp. BCRC 34962]|nr:hypothetical protein IW152_003894 [Coemansia sp. BCRC 34962]
MSEETLEMRVYIGGLTQAVTDVDVCSRFKPFGEVRSVELPPTATGEGCRGFGYVNMKITATQWRRCVSLYTGAKWKGGKLRIEEAKEDYKTRLQHEWAEAKEPPAIIADKDERLALRKRKMYASAASDGLEVEDMTLVTDKNISRYLGWTKGRYGRPVLKYSVIRPSGKALNYDPAKYKSAFERLVPVAGVEPKSSKDLQWEYDVDAATGDFEAARQMPQSALNVIEKMCELGAKQQRLEDEAQRVQKRLRIQSGADEAGSHSTAQAPVSSVESVGGVVEFELDNVDDATIDAALELAPFEDAEDIALLASSRNAVAAPELQAKLASGAFDSDSESESEKPARSAAKSKSVAVAAKIEEQASAFDEEAAALVRERERMSAIVLQLLAQEPSSFESGFAGSAPVDGSEKQKMSQKSRDYKPSGNKGKGAGKANGSSNGSGSDSSSSGSNGSSDGGSDQGSDQGSDKGSSDKTGDDSSSDSDEGSDEESESEAESDSGGDGAMDVDESSKSALSSLFGGDQQHQIGSSLFGGPSGGFRFTEALGLEADEPSEMINDDDEEGLAPVTGGARLSGPAERNLNANRLPAFFPDVDSPMFRRPKPVFQRQKTEEELEADLERTSKEMTKEYKAQLRSTVRKVQKLSDRKAPRRPN